MTPSQARAIGQAQLKLDSVSEVLDKLQVTLARRPLVTWFVEGVEFRGPAAIALIFATRNCLNGLKSEVMIELAKLEVKEE